MIKRMTIEDEEHERHNEEKDIFRRKSTAGREVDGESSVNLNPKHYNSHNLIAVQCNTKI